jgi:hypothetical protein
VALERARAEATPQDEPPPAYLAAVREPKGRKRYVAIVVDEVPTSVVINTQGACDPERDRKTWMWLTERIRRDRA